MSSPNKDRLRTRRTRVLLPIDRNSLSLTLYSVNHTEPKDATNILIHNQEEDKRLDEAKAEYAVNQRLKRSLNRAKYDEELERNRRALRDVKIEENTPLWMGNTATGLNVLNLLASSFVPLYGAVQAPLYAAIGDTDTAKERVLQTLIPTALATGNPYVIAGINGYMMGEAANDIANNGLNFGNGLTLGLSALGTPLMLQTVRLLGTGVGKVNQFLTSPLTGKWTTFGNRLYRLNPNTLGMNGVPIESLTLPWEEVVFPRFRSSIGRLTPLLEKFNARILEYENKARTATTQEEYLKAINNLQKELEELSVMNRTVSNPRFGQITGPTYDNFSNLRTFYNITEPNIITTTAKQLTKLTPEVEKWLEERERLGKEGEKIPLPDELRTPENIAYLKDYFADKTVHPDFPFGTSQEEILKAIKEAREKYGFGERANRITNSITNEGYYSTDSYLMLLNDLINGINKGRKVYVSNTPNSYQSLNRFGKVNYPEMNRAWYKGEMYHGGENSPVTVPFTDYSSQAGENYIPHTMSLDVAFTRHPRIARLTREKLGKDIKAEDLLDKIVVDIYDKPDDVINKINNKYKQLNMLLSQYGEEVKPFEDGNFIRFDEELQRFILPDHVFTSFKNGGKIKRTL